MTAVAKIKETVSVHSKGRRAVEAWYADEQTGPVDPDFDVQAVSSHRLPRTSAALIGTGCPLGCMYWGHVGDQFEKAVHLLGAGPFRRALVVGVFAGL